MFGEACQSKDVVTKVALPAGQATSTSTSETQVQTRDVVTDVSEIPHVSMQENVGNFQNMRKECQIKTFDGLGPFSYVCRMISFEPNTTETHMSEACVNFEDFEITHFESCGPQFETSEMIFFFSSLAERAITAVPGLRLLR